MFLAIDIGGTYLKIGHCDVGTGTITNVTRRGGVEPLIGLDGKAELDPVELLAKVRLAVGEFVAGGEVVDGVLLTGQMHSWVLTNVRGTPVSPIVTWRDTYNDLADNSEDSEDLLTSVSECLGNHLIESSGNELRHGIPAVSLFARTRGGFSTQGRTLHTLTSFVANQLAGQSNNCLIHLTDAAALGLVAVEHGNWNREIIYRLGLQQLSLPTIVDELTEVGRMPEFGIPVYVAIGDQQSALLGFKLRRSEISLNIATGSQISRIVDSPLANCQTRPYFRNQLLATFTHIPAGRALNTIIGGFARFSGMDDKDAWSKVLYRINEIQSPQKLSVVPTFFQSPHGSAGTISGLTESNFNAEEIFLSAIEWIIKTYSQCVEELDPDRSIRSIAVTGGLGTRIPYFRRRLTETFSNREVRFFDGDDASLSGLAILAYEYQIGSQKKK